MMKVLVYIPLLLVSFASAAKDITRRERATGREVVETVVRQVTRSRIFAEDHNFLTRLAYVETHFGADGDTFRTNYNGGLWQVDEKTYAQTKALSLSIYHAEVLKQFKINWNSTAWSDLRKPLYSGLAAALYFQLKPPVPDTIFMQSVHWKIHYRTGNDMLQFEKAAEELRASSQSQCRGKMDFLMVLDGSGSISAEQYQVAKNFVAALTLSFSRDLARIGMLVYSNANSVIFEIKNSFTAVQLAEKAQNAFRPGYGGTNTAEAIQEGVQMFIRSRDSAQSRKGIPQIMAVFTDGVSANSSIIPPAVAQAVSASIRTLAIGIEGWSDNTELLMISNNDTQSMFTLAGFSSLEGFLERIKTVACETPQTPEIGQQVEDNLVHNEKRIYRLEVPLAGITVKLKVSSGKAYGFWSRSEPVPTSAYNNGEIKGATFIPASDKSVVYITVQGLTKNNAYTLTTEKGNKTGGNSNGCNSISVTSSLFVIIVSFELIKTSLMQV